MGGDRERRDGPAFTCKILACRLIAIILQSALARVDLVGGSDTTESCRFGSRHRHARKFPYYRRFERLPFIALQSICWPTARQFTVELGWQKIRELIEKKWTYPCSLRYSIDSCRLLVTSSTLIYKYCVQWTNGKTKANVYFNIKIKRLHPEDVVSVSYTFENGTALHTPRSSRFHVRWLQSLDRYCEES